MSSSTSDLQFDDPGRSLTADSGVSEKCTEGEIAIIMDMTLEDPRLEKVTFGKAHVGKTFQEMVTETKYLTWFTETFRHSRKPEHVKLLRICAAPPGAAREESCESQQECDHAQGQSQDASSCPADDDRLGVGGGRDLLGSSPRRRRADATPPSRSNEPNGDGDARSTGTPEANSHRGTQLDQESDRCQIASPTLVADLCEAWQDIHNHLSFEPVDVFGDRDVGETILFTRETNWVAQEMWEHFAQKGIYPDSPVLRKSAEPDLLEVYCSQDSQLTKHARSKSMWAERHCLSDGDLATMEDRKKLYDRLLHLLPRDIWLSPKCKAWCKWNEFNSKRSTSLATKIMNARKADEVHLLLCDALFQFQTCRAPTCHAHLEQPSGSQSCIKRNWLRFWNSLTLAAVTCAKLETCNTRSPICICRSEPKLLQLPRSCIVGWKP